MFNRIKQALAVLFLGTQDVPPQPIPSPAQNVRALFADPRFTWRSIEALHQVSGLASIDQTRSLVLALGARRSELTREVYTMPFGTMPLSIAQASVTNPDAETQIRAALEDERFQWRSIDALVKASGLSVDATRDLLEAMGARKGTDDAGVKELYTLN